MRAGGAPSTTVFDVPCTSFAVHTAALRCLPLRKRLHPGLFCRFSDTSIVPGSNPSRPRRVGMVSVATPSSSVVACGPSTFSTPPRRVLYNWEVNSKPAPERPGVVMSLLLCKTLPLASTSSFLITNLAPQPAKDFLNSSRRCSNPLGRIMRSWLMVSSSFSWLAT